MVAVSAAVVGADRAAAQMLALSAGSDAKVRGVVNHYGHLLRAQVMRNASGRPGPKVVTGDYRRSITLRTGGGGGNFVAVVGTSNPQGRRLEYGFHGADSLGRVYAQPPFPHWGPAADFILPQFVRAMGAVV